MKKRVWKRILVVLLVLVVIVGAAGLVLVKSAADMVPRMQERLEQATSIHYMYYMDIDASFLATTSSARISGDISMVMSDPVAMEMDYERIRTGGSEPVSHLCGPRGRFGKGVCGHGG